MAKRALLAVEMEDVKESINMMIFGPTGVGKTVLAGTAPNALFLASENGVIAAKRAGSKAKVIHITSFDMAWEVLEAAETGAYEGVEWFILDTVDSIQNRRMRQILDADKAASPAKRDAYIPGMDQHQKVQNSIKRLMERFVDLPVNCLFLVHSMRVEDNDGEAMLMPAIEGQATKGYGVSSYCMSLVDVVAYMGVTASGGEEVRRLVCQHTTDANKGITYVAKDRYGVLPRFMDNPTMPEIIGYITAPVKQTGNKKGKAKANA